MCDGNFLMCLDYQKAWPVSAEDRPVELPASHRLFLSVARAPVHVSGGARHAQPSGGQRNRSPETVHRQESKEFQSRHSVWLQKCVFVCVCVCVCVCVSWVHMCIVFLYISAFMGLVIVNELKAFIRTHTHTLTLTNTQHRCQLKSCTP